MQFVNRGLYLPQRYSDRNGAAQQGRFSSSVTVGTDRLLVSAIAGKRIFVPWIVCYAAATASYLTFKSSSGAHLNLRVPPDTGEIPNVILPFNEAGWIDVPAGESLLVDVFTTNSVVSLIWYAYAP